MNTPITGHRMVGEVHTYRPDLPVPDKKKIDARTVVAPGMEVTIRAVFRDWNDVDGLDMLYVEVSETGYCTHVTPYDLGLRVVLTDDYYERRI